MADVHSPETRSYNMSRIHGKDTKPEEKVRKYLFSQGFRYRKNDKRLPGKPDMVLPKYLFYLLQNEHLEKLNNAGVVPSLTQSVLNKVKLYIPSLDEQHRIVCTLDYFKSICSKLQSNISTELEARQKQYEYYRDKLLTFKELK